MPQGPAAKLFDKGHCKVGKSITICPYRSSQNTVNIGVLPALRFGDIAIGGDGIIIGYSTTVFAGGRPMARVTDQTTYGIMVGPGNPTVIVG